MAVNNTAGQNTDVTNVINTVPINKYWSKTDIIKTN